MIVVALVGIVYQSRQIGEFSVADLLTGFSAIPHLTDQLTNILLCHKLLQAYATGLLNSKKGHLICDTGRYIIYLLGRIIIELCTKSCPTLLHAERTPRFSKILLQYIMLLMYTRRLTELSESLNTINMLQSRKDMV